MVLGALRPAVVAMIGSAGLSILLLGLFQSDLFHVSLANLRVVELGIFIASLYILRKFKVSAVLVILGSGVVGTICYLLPGLVNMA